VNWKIIAALALPMGVIVGALTTLGLLSGILLLLVWIAFAIMARQIILVHAPHKPFTHGFLIAALAGLISGNFTALFMDVLFANTNYLTLTNQTAGEVTSGNFIIGGGINGVLFGLLAGGIAGWKTRGQANAQAAALADDSEE
jgi:hypothetical protein